MCSRTWRGKTRREHAKEIFPFSFNTSLYFSWRFESLKSRCVLIDRENLLTEHNITFKPMNAMEFDIKEAQLQAALPRIVSVAAAANCGRDTPPPNVVIALDTPLKTTYEGQKEMIDFVTPLKIENHLKKMPQAEVQLKQELPTLEQPDQVHCKMEPQEVEDKVAAAVQEAVVKKGTPVKSRVGLIKVKTDQQLMSPKQADDLQLPVKPNRKGTPVKIKTELMDDEKPLPLPAKPQLKGTPVKVKEEAIDTHIIESKPLRKGTPVRAKSSEVEQPSHPGQVRSILTKKRDLFTEDAHKNVQFSSSDPIVHNLSPDVPSPPTCSKENEKPAEQDIKPVKKSQNIIRRIVVAPKKATFTLK